MAAEAPITAKKEAYSGLAPEDMAARAGPDQGAARVGERVGGGKAENSAAAPVLGGQCSATKWRVSGRGRRSRDGGAGRAAAGPGARKVRPGGSGGGARAAP